MAGLRGVQENFSFENRCCPCCVFRLYPAALMAIRRFRHLALALALLLGVAAVAASGERGALTALVLEGTSAEGCSHVEGARSILEDVGRLHNLLGPPAEAKEGAAARALAGDWREVLPREPVAAAVRPAARGHAGPPLRYLHCVYRL